MKFVAQHPLTHAYLRPDGTWGKELDQARDFGSASLAILFCSHELEGPVQVVLKMEHAPDEIVLLNVPDERAETPKPTGS